MRKTKGAVVSIKNVLMFSWHSLDLQCIWLFYLHWTYFNIIYSYVYISNKVYNSLNLVIIIAIVIPRVICGTWNTNYAPELIHKNYISNPKLITYTRNILSAPLWHFNLVIMSRKDRCHINNVIRIELKCLFWIRSMKSKQHVLQLY